MSQTTKLTDLTKLRIDRSTTAPEPRKRSNRMIWGVAVAMVLSGSTGLIVWLHHEAALEVRTVHARVVTNAASPSLSATGYVVAHHKIDVNSKVTGRVKWIGVEKGDAVKAGQVLVELEDEEFRAQVQQAHGQVQAARAYLEELQAGSRPQEITQALSNLEQARATLRDDQIVLQRTRLLADQGVLARQQLDDALARYDSDVEKVKSLEQAYSLAKVGPREEEIARARGALTQAQGQLAYAESQLGATRIRTPIDGTILERTAEVGELITSTFASTAAGGPIGSVVSLANLKDLQVELDIAQNDFSKLHSQHPALITTDAYPDRKYQGSLAEVAPQANRQKATVQVKVQIQNPDNFLKPDLNATVLFLSDLPSTNSMATTPGIRIPANAIHLENGRPQVFVAFQGRAVARDVQVIRDEKDGVLVSGLIGGEDVIVDAPASLRDGKRIRRKE